MMVSKGTKQNTPPRRVRETGIETMAQVRVGNGHHGLGKLDLFLSGLWQSCASTEHMLDDQQILTTT